MIGSLEIDPIGNGEVRKMRTQRMDVGSSKLQVWINRQLWQSPAFLSDLRM